MKDRTRAAGDLPLKLLAGILILACLALGVVGLVLPIIPGLIFLAVAVLIAARHFPAVRGLLGRNARIGSYMERADRFFDLAPGRQLQVGGLVCLKVLLDGCALVTSALAKVLGAGAGRSGQAR